MNGVKEIMSIFLGHQLIIMNKIKKDNLNIKMCCHFQGAVATLM